MTTLVAVLVFSVPPLTVAPPLMVPLLFVVLAVLVSPPLMVPLLPVAPELATPPLTIPALLSPPVLLTPPFTVPVALLVSVPALVMTLSDVRVPALVRVAPTLLATLIALSVRVAAILMPFALVELLVSVVMPVKLPPLTRSCAVPLLVKVLLPLSVR